VWRRICRDCNTQCGLNGYHKFNFTSFDDWNSLSGEAKLRFFYFSLTFIEEYLDGSSLRFWLMVVDVTNIFMSSHRSHEAMAILQLKIASLGKILKEVLGREAVNKFHWLFHLKYDISQHEDCLHLSTFAFESQMIHIRSALKKTGNDNKATSILTQFAHRHICELFRDVTRPEPRQVLQYVTSVTCLQECS